jgi:hypothetical protein
VRAALDRHIARDRHAGGPVVDAGAQREAADVSAAQVDGLGCPFWKGP